MSWSISLVGTTATLAESLTAQSATMEGQSKLEYDEALPHMVGLVNQNFGNATAQFKLEANGHGWVENGVQVNRNLSISLFGYYPPSEG